MRFSFTFAAVAALTTSVVYSQSISELVAQIPTCAVTCLATAATSVNCGMSDYSCQCGAASAAMATTAASCLATSCNSHDAGVAVSLAEQICTVVNCASSSSLPPIPASTITSATPSATPSVAPSVTSSAAPPPPPSTSTSPSATPQPTSNAGSKLHAGAAVAGAVFFAAMAL